MTFTLDLTDEELGSLEQLVAIRLRYIEELKEAYPRSYEDSRKRLQGIMDKMQRARPREESDQAMVDRLDPSEDVP